MTDVTLNNMDLLIDKYAELYTPEYVRLVELLKSVDRDWEDLSREDLSAILDLISGQALYNYTHKLITKEQLKEDYVNIEYRYNHLHKENDRTERNKLLYMIIQYNRVLSLIDELNR